MQDRKNVTLAVNRPDQAYELKKQRRVQTKVNRCNEKSRNTETVESVRIENMRGGSLISLKRNLLRIEMQVHIPFPASPYQKRIDYRGGGHFRVYSEGWFVRFDLL